jgi:hypothetical protein
LFAFSVSLLHAPPAFAEKAIAVETADAAVGLAPLSALEPGQMLVVDGVHGRWFPTPTALQLLQDHLQVAKYSELASNYEALRVTLAAKADLTDQRLKLWQEAATLADGRAQIATNEMKRTEAARVASNREARSLENQLHAWYRSPALWFGSGVVLSSVAITAASIAAH